MSTLVVRPERLREFVSAPRWYHTVELPGGLLTNGTYDHRPHVSKYGLPADLSGTSVLDVGTSDGYFAFELERRGAREVIALDRNLYDGTLPLEVAPTRRATYEEKYAQEALERASFSDVYESLGVPVGHQFLALRHLLDSSATYLNGDVYELARMGRRFDVVMCGDLIEHLKDPLRALEQLHAVTGNLCVVSLSSALRGSTGGSVVGSGILKAVAKLFGLPLAEEDRIARYVGDSGGSFFQFAAGTLRRALHAAGFSDVRAVGRFNLMNRRQSVENYHVIFHCRR